MQTLKKPVVALLFGGQSSEHEISCATAAGIMEAIDRDKWDVIAIGVTKAGQWVRLPVEPELYRLSESGGYEVTATNRQVALLPGPSAKRTPRLIEFDVDAAGEVLAEPIANGENVDVVFPVLHGPYGEDGSLQGLLELVPVRYVGCGIAASAVAMDKRLTKTVLEQNGLPVGNWMALTKNQVEKEGPKMLEDAKTLGFPQFVKPCRAGSSMGISKVDGPNQFLQAVHHAAEHDPQMIVEAAHSGRELECGVLQLPDGKLVASPLGEIIVADNGFYDYETKYFSPERTQLECPAQLPQSDQRKLQRAAKEAFTALGCEGLARVDFFYTEDSGEFIINEVNTMPGFTPYSMYPKALEQAGFSYSQLVETLLQQALVRPRGLR